MDGRTDVVLETGQRQLLGARTAADRVVCFQDQHRVSGAGQDDSSGKAVGPGADDYSIEISHSA